MILRGLKCLVGCLFFGGRGSKLGADRHMGRLGDTLDGTGLNHHTDDLTSKRAVDLVGLNQVVDSDDLERKDK
jgi:hypothetical protein